jgi:hypothetical protein
MTRFPFPVAEPVWAACTHPAETIGAAAPDFTHVKQQPSK